MPKVTASSTQSNNTMPFLNSAHSPTGPGPSPFSPDVTSAPASYRNSQNEPNGTHGEHHPNRRSGDFDDSRRSSTTGGIHQGMHNLGLGPTSPYHSNNHSQSSLTAGLQQQRGISNGYTPARYSTMNGPISPYASHRGGRGGFTPGRVAPLFLKILNQKCTPQKHPLAVKPMPSLILMRSLPGDRHPCIRDAIASQIRSQAVS